MRILIAEDEPVSRLRLERMLTRWGYEVIAVADGVQAWRELSGDDAPGLAILDWQMPGRDGVSLCRKVRQLKDTAYVYMVLLTARSAANGVVEAMNAGADDFLSKPFEPHELEARLRAGQRILELQDELIETRETLREQAIRDDLTGIHNRRAILEDLDRELARAARSSGNAGLGVLIADLDHFQQLNDRYGHLVGDDVLREAARRLSKQVRRYDSLGRMGDEEFVLLLADCDREHVVAAAERIRRLVAEQPIDTATGPLRITSSLGATWVPHGKRTTAREVLDAADRALYAAKARGRNRLCFDRRPAGQEERSSDGLLIFSEPLPGSPRAGAGGAETPRPRTAKA